MKTKPKPLLRDLVKASTMSSLLVRAIVKRFGEWPQFTILADAIITEGFDKADIPHHRHDDILAFYHEHRRAILDHIEDAALALHKNSVSMVLSFPALRTIASTRDVALTLYSQDKRNHDYIVAGAIIHALLRTLALTYSKL